MLPRGRGDLVASDIRIPPSQEQPLARLLNMADAEAESLRAALEEAEPAASFRALSDFVARTAGLPPESAHEFTRLLAVLHSRRGPTPLEEFLDSLERAGRAVETAELKSPERGWEHARDRLRTLLALKPLQITSKALDVLTEHEKVFCSARVLTDIRPVFAEDVGREPDGFVLVHNLRLAFHQNNRVEACYVAMDSADIETLLELLQRAKEKEAAIEGTVRGSGALLLGSKTH